MLQISLIKHLCSSSAFSYMTGATPGVFYKASSNNSTIIYKHTSLLGYHHAMKRWRYKEQNGKFEVETMDVVESEMYVLVKVSCISLLIH